MSICVECAAWKRDCCHATHEDKISHRFSLTLADAQRIAKVLQISVKEFAQVVPTDRDFANEVEKVYPGSGRMFAHDQRLILRFDGERGACRILGPEGCRLSLYDRPRFCALYPSWYAFDGQSLEIYLVAFGENCLAYQRQKQSNHGKVAEILQRRGGVAVRPDHALELIGTSTSFPLFARSSNRELELHAKTPWEAIHQLCAL